MPQRIQRKRTRGWKMPPGTVSVSRPSAWGNPFVIGIHGNAEEVTQMFADHMERMRIKEPRRYRALLEPLRGKNLACFCALDEPCHADVLLDLVKELEEQNAAIPE